LYVFAIFWCFLSFILFYFFCIDRSHNVC